MSVIVKRKITTTIDISFHMNLIDFKSSDVGIVFLRIFTIRYPFTRVIDYNHQILHQTGNNERKRCRFKPELILLTSVKQ